MREGRKIGKGGRSGSVGRRRQAGRQLRAAGGSSAPLTLFLDDLEESEKLFTMAITMNTVILRTPTGLLKILEIVRHI